MRISIRTQLGLLVLLCVLIPLAVLAIAVWINNHAFVVGITSSSLTLTASLKASQIASDLLLIQSTCATIVTRLLLQRALVTFYQGNTTTENWDVSTTDIQSALASGGYSSLLQTIVYSRNSSGNSGGLLNVTALAPGIQLPALYPNGTHAMLGDNSTLGYPTALYPNITYVSQNYTDDLDSNINGTEAYAFADLPLNATSFLLLGPLQINESYALVSLTLPITNNDNRSQILGYMTVVAAATSLMSVIESREGLGTTGIVGIIGPSRRENQFKYAERPSAPDYMANTTAVAQALVHYILPPTSTSGSNRHSEYNQNITNYGSSNFTLRQYPAALRGFTSQDTTSPSNASSSLSTTNEQGVKVAVGYARPQSELVSWLLVVEQSHDEAWAPIIHLRNILLACVFGTIGFILLIVIPMAHFSVRPITRLRDATQRSITPPGYTPEGSLRSETGDPDELGELENGTSQKSKRGIFVRLRNIGSRRRRTIGEKDEDDRRRTFRIPGKVPSRKHWVTDELTELTDTFNNMSDELMLQYTGLEQKVSERTAELEVSKRAAEAANESKTLFIANISHELKTPLNGVLGMCSVMMHEVDLDKIKRGLQIVHKSGDLLLNLLTDLLLFSKNQIGQQLSLEEKEFRLNDIKTQVKTLFTNQVKEGNINFHVVFVGMDSDGVFSDPDSSGKLPALGPTGVRLKDMCLWGDHNRILQVIINLVGNALKFTPPFGKVEVRIKCIGEVDTSDGGRNSMGSKVSSQRSKNRHRNDSDSNASHRKPPSFGHTAGTALVINPMDSKALPRVQSRDRSRSPPPANAKSMWFQFDVEDTGPGIPQDMQERVFEPFVQGDLGLSKKYGGTGLGLSICSQLATLMGGNISLTSKEGSGSTFTLRIPLRHTKTRAPSTSSSEMHLSRAPSLSDDGPSGQSRKAPIDAGPRSALDNDKQPRLVGLSQPFFAVPPSPPVAENTAQTQLEVLNVAAAAKAPGSKVRVLVAEDNLVNQEVVLRMLNLEGKFDVVVAKDGQEAYDKVKEEMGLGQYFDVIFMDIQMPNLDGLQSTRLIRQMGYSAPIVALTAFSEESNVKECLASGMDYFLSKPIRRPALKQVLKKFAPIPEEVETPSPPSDKASSAKSSETEVNGKSETTTSTDTPSIPIANGSPH